MNKGSKLLLNNTGLDPTNVITSALKTRFYSSKPGGWRLATSYVDFQTVLCKQYCVMQTGV